MCYFTLPPCWWTIRLICLKHSILTGLNVIMLCRKTAKGLQIAVRYTPRDNPHDPKVTHAQSKV
jgi:hypothetical protein